MPSNYKFEYNVDIVFCIDCTESMDNILNIVKGRALGLYDDIQCKMSSKGKKISQLRVRLIGFRDYVAYADEFRRKVHPNEPMMVTDFFSFPQDAHKLEISVKSLYPVGGGDIQGGRFRSIGLCHPIPMVCDRGQRSPCNCFMDGCGAARSRLWRGHIALPQGNGEEF